MPEIRDHQRDFQKAAMYDLLAQYYKYIDPGLHVQYYQLHLKYVKKALLKMRTEAIHRLQPAHVRILHASPDAPEVDIYVNGNRLVKNFSYKEASGYLSIPAGRYQIDIYPAGTMVSAVLSKKIHVDAGKHYTLAAIGPADKLRLLSFEDHPRVPQGEAKVKFIHLSPDAPAVDLAVKNGDVVFPDIRYKQASRDLALTPMTVDLELRKAGTSEAVLEIPSVNFQRNKDYTLVAVGLINKEPGLEMIILNA